MSGQPKVCGHCGRTEVCDDEQHCPLLIHDIDHGRTLAQGCTESNQPRIDGRVEAAALVIRHKIDCNGGPTLAECENVDGGCDFGSNQ